MSPAQVHVEAGSDTASRQGRNGEAALLRTLRLRDLILIVLGAVIGSGIFIVPGTVMQQLGGGVLPALAVWVVAGVLSVLGALTYGELGAMNPEAGGLYVYVRDAFGPLPAFLLGWTFLFVIGSGSLATLAVAFGSYVERLIALGPTTARAVPLLMIAVLAAINVRGIRAGVRVGNTTTLLKASAILVMSLVFLAAGDELPTLRGHLWLEGGPVAWLSGVGIAMVGVLWAYEGWQYATFSAGETHDPARVFPIGIVLGTAAIVVLYLLANVAYLAALGSDGVSGSGAVAAAATARLFGPGAERLVALAIAISMFSAANAQLITAPRIYYRMGRDGVFFRALGKVDPRTGTPVTAILATSSWAVVLAATGTFEQLLSYVVFAGWIFYALGALSIFVFRRRQPDAPRPFRVPGYPFTPLIFTATAAAVVLNTLIVQPAQALFGLGIVLIGAPLYIVWSRSA